MFACVLKIKGIFNGNKVWLSLLLLFIYIDDGAVCNDSDFPFNVSQCWVPNLFPLSDLCFTTINLTICSRLASGDDDATISPAPQSFATVLNLRYSCLNEARDEHRA